MRLFYDYSRGFGDDRAKVVSLLGTPSRVVATAAPNRDTAFLLMYPTASFSAGRRAADQLENLWEFTVWGPLRGLPSVIAPGVTTRSELVGMIERPDYEEAEGDTTVITYQLPNPDWTEFLDFHIVRDTVRLMRWRFRMG